MLQILLSKILLQILNDCKLDLNKVFENFEYHSRKIFLRDSQRLEIILSLDNFLLNELLMYKINKFFLKFKFLRILQTVQITIIILAKQINLT